MKQLKQCFDDCAGAQKLANPGGKSKWLFKGFDHAASCAVVTAIAKVQNDSNVFDDGVCLGLAMAFLGHRRLKDRVMGASDAQEQAEIAYFIRNHERIFGEIFDTSTKFRKLMSGEESKQAAHKPVYDAMVAQKQNVAYKQSYHNLVSKDIATAEAGPHKKVAIEQTLQLLEQAKLKIQQANLALYRRLGETFLAGMSIDTAPVVGSPLQAGWARGAKFDGSRHKLGYHLIDLDNHAMAMTINHTGPSYKFFEPNAGIVTSDQYGAFADLAEAYLTNWSETTIWSWFG